MIAFLIKGYAQEELLKELSYPTAQLTFSGTFQVYDKLKINRPKEDALYSKYAPSGMFQFGYHHPLNHGFGINAGAGFSIKSYDLRMKNRDFNVPTKKGYVSTGMASADNLIFTFPISVQKLFSVKGKGNYMLLEGGLVANAQMFTEANGGIGASRGDSDTSDIEYLDASHTSTHNTWLLSGFAKIGIQHMSKDYSTLSLKLVGNYGGLNYARGTYWLIDRGNYYSGSYRSSLSYAGLELSYGYGLKPRKNKRQATGYVAPKRPQYDRSLWLGASIGFMNPNEKISDKNGYYAPSPYAYGKASFWLEWNSMFNYKLNYAFNELAIEMCYSPEIMGFGGSSSYSFGSYVHAMDFLFGKTLLKTKEEGIRIKPWIGIGANYLSGMGKKNSIIGYGSVEIGDSTDIQFSDTTITYLVNRTNSRLSAALEFEFRIFRHLYFSFIPSYSLGIKKLYRTNMIYSTPELTAVNASMYTSYSQWNLQFGIKIPLYRH